MERIRHHRKPVSPEGKKVIVEKNVGNRWEWETVAECKFAVNVDKLEFAIPREVLGLEGEDVDIEFKWNDNMQDNGNIMDFYVNGDTAPEVGSISSIQP